MSFMSYYMVMNERVKFLLSCNFLVQGETNNLLDSTEELLRVQRFLHH